MQEEKKQLIYKQNLKLRIVKLTLGTVIPLTFLYLAIDSNLNFINYLIFFSAFVVILFFLDFLFPSKIMTDGKNLIIRKLFSIKTIRLHDVISVESRTLKLAEQSLVITDENYTPPEKHGVYINFSTKNHLNSVHNVTLKLLEDSKEVCKMVETKVRSLIISCV